MTRLNFCWLIILYRQSIFLCIIKSILFSLKNAEFVAHKGKRDSFKKNYIYRNIYFKSKKLFLFLGIRFLELNFLLCKTKINIKFSRYFFLVCLSVQKCDISSLLWICLCFRENNILLEAQITDHHLLTLSKSVKSY